LSLWQGKRQEARGKSKSEEGLGDFTSLYTVWFYCVHLLSWRYLKSFVTRSCGHKLQIPTEISLSREKRQEKNLWQRRYWEHLITNEKDFSNHCDYIHYNSVKHGLCQSP
jgi:REP element-mobilizing transposase RayT